MIDHRIRILLAYGSDEYNYAVIEINDLNRAKSEKQTNKNNAGNKQYTMEIS